MTKIGVLHVEGPSDVSVINALLRRHGVDTRGGKSYLEIASNAGVTRLLRRIPLSIKGAIDDRPIGFVVDIDTTVAARWQAVCDRIANVTGAPSMPDECPPDGYIGTVQSSSTPFGVWLMPDCQTDGQALEDLVQSLLYADDPLWPHASKSTVEAATAVDDANKTRATPYERFGDRETMKAQLYAWLAWQPDPGRPLGAILANDQGPLQHDHPAAVAFLGWLKRLYGLNQLPG